MSKVKSYCMRFKKCLVRTSESVTLFFPPNAPAWCRNFKYDESIQEFFVTTQDTVKVKLSEMEKWMKQTTGDDEAWDAWFFLLDLCAWKQCIHGFTLWGYRLPCLMSSSTWSWWTLQLRRLECLQQSLQGNKAPFLSTRWMHSKKIWRPLLIRSTRRGARWLHGFRLLRLYKPKPASGILVQFFLGMAVTAALHNCHHAVYERALPLYSFIFFFCYLHYFSQSQVCDWHEQSDCFFGEVFPQVGWVLPQLGDGGPHNGY